MEKLEKVKNKLALLNDEQLDLIDKLISSWKISNNELQTNEEIVKQVYENSNGKIEDPLENYSKEELLEEYGMLFYNQQSTEQHTDLSNIEIQYNSTENKTDDKYANLDILSLISKKPGEKLSEYKKIYDESNVEPSNIDDFDPLFPDTDFDSLTGLNKSKYDGLDFSTLISKKPK